MSTALQDLLDEPTLPEAVAVLNARLDDERARRELFYDELLPDQKAEFINGEVVMHSPAMSRHLKATLLLSNLVHNFVLKNQLGFVYVEKALCVFPRNDYEPDIVFFGPQKAGLIHDNTLKFPIPDFVCEVLSESTERTDRGIKFRDYEAHGVREYWLIDVVDEVLEQYLLGDNGYALRMKSGDGHVTSTVIPGLVIPIRAVFDSELNQQTLLKLLSE